jgi:sugar lactone lactonase YvrE
VTKISRVETAVCTVGEGALWDAEAGALYFLDIVGRKVHRYDPASGTTRSWSTPRAVGAMALRQRGGVVLGMTDGFYTLDLDSGAVEPLASLADASERTTINDGKADRNGRFVVGLCSQGFDNPQPLGGVYGLDADHGVRRLDGGITFSNSPCFSPNGRTLYFADSFVYAVYAYDYDPATGQAANKRLFADTRALGGMPDGATVDAEGRVWMAIFEAGKIACFRPDGGVERLVDAPVKLVSSVAFGGPGLDQLYVTSLDPAFMGKPAEPGGGHLHVIEGLGARGLAEPRYAG